MESKGPRFFSWLTFPQEEQALHQPALPRKVVHGELRVMGIM